STFVYLGLSLGVLLLVGGVAYEWHQERTAAARAAKAPKTAAARAAPREAQRAPVPIPAQAVSEENKPLEEKKPVVGGHRLVVRTEEEAWIEVRDSADRMLVSSLNPAGSERVVRGKPPYSLVIGNASRVSVRYDDKPVDLAPHTKADVARLTIP
ncbi:MAG: DUF4115 domain-containing protein, partial [Burkholderiales bacterium]